MLTCFRSAADKWLLLLFFTTAPLLPGTQSPEVEDWVLTPVDRTHPVADDFIPPRLQNFPLGKEGKEIPLNRETGEALQQLFAAAAAEDLRLEVSTGYRDTAFQKALHENWIQWEMDRGAANRQEAAEKASRYSAPPGYSEHHLGTAADINEQGTPQFQALEDDLYRFLTRCAHHYGFVLSYPPGREADTGYRFEPWHLRWVGRETAGKIYEAGYLNGGITPNQYFLRLRKKGAPQ